MDADERTKWAIYTTRTLLDRILSDPRAMIMLTNSNIVPEDIQDDVFYILGYLEKTKPDKETEKKCL